MAVTKEQQEIIDFTRAEFNQHPIEERAKMYEVLMFVASLKWPEHKKDFEEAYERGKAVNWEFKE